MSNQFVYHSRLSCFESSYVVLARLRYGYKNGFSQLASVSLDDEKKLCAYSKFDWLKRLHPNWT